MSFICILLGVLGMFLSSPRGAGADENLHQATAWYDGTHLLPAHVDLTPVSEIPRILIDHSNSCYKFDYRNTSVCQTSRADLSSGMSSSIVYNYPPFYYYIVFLGEKLFSLFSYGYLDVGGRLFSMLLNFLVLGYLALGLRRQRGNWGSILLAVVTPMAAFYWAVINPSGLEVSSALLFTFLFSSYLWNERTPTSRVPLMLTSLLLALSRPLGSVWIVLIAVSAFLLAPHRVVADRARKGFWSAAPGVAIAVMYNFIYRSNNGSNGAIKGDLTLSNYFEWFRLSLKNTSTLIRDMFGNLGWLDTPMPDGLISCTLAIWIFALFFAIGREKNSKRVLTISIFAVFLVPAAIETAFWKNWPYWWQGRYSLPIFLSFAFLILLRMRNEGTRVINFLSSWSLLIMGLMILLNANRYSYGILGYMPIHITNPAMGVLRFYSSLALGCLLVLLGGYRITAWLYRIFISEPPKKKILV